MDLLFPYFLHLAVLCVSLSLIFMVYKRKSSNIKLPPGKTGWPIVGETWEYVLGSVRGEPEKFTNDRTIKYSSEVYQTSLFGHQMAVFCGPSANKFVSTTANQYVTSWLPESMEKVLYAPEKVDNSTLTEEVSVVLRNMLPEFLKPEPLKRQIPIMDSMAKEHLMVHWLPHKQVKVLPLTKKYTFGLACRLFIKIKDPEHVTRLENLFTVLIKGMAAIPINVPGTAFYQSVKAGKLIREELLAIMKQRKEELRLMENKGGEEVDLLTRMLRIALAGEGGEAMSYSNIPNKMIGVLFASNDTINSSIIAVMNYLAENPHVYSKVLFEQMEISKSKATGELLNWEDIQKMKYSWCVACEAMRLMTPGGGGFRKAISDLSFAGFDIPKGWKLHWSAYSTHKNPKYFPNPDKFDPSRFEENGPAPYTFVPFGAGPRMCPGKEYARSEILVFMHNVVTKFKWRKMIPDEKFTYITFPRPLNGLPIHLQPHDQN